MSNLHKALLLLLALPLSAACKTGVPSVEGEHWVVDSVPQRLVKRFTGYRPDLDGEFIDFQFRKKKHISKTLRRTFLNNSSENPFEAYDPSQTARRHAHSIAPDPVYYMHAESIFIGFAALGVTGAFVPIPIDSVIATVASGGDGWREFGRGFAGGGSAKKPQATSRFRVKNR
jgi:hypothetical protein